ncbi:MAG: hypothetical protein KDI30_03735 [Pseudomonadales bacterium]|nr:hypothetical protein [Pseudomonadales bacterium]
MPFMVRALFYRKFIVLLLLFLPFFFLGKFYTRTPEVMWYPFITSAFNDYYTAGPFGMTSNVREDNPVWQEIPAINKSLSRMSYAMTRGQPDVDIAWLYAEQEWPDKAALGEGLTPNKSESELSRSLAHAGFVYDRVSQRNLLDATNIEGALHVGAMKYKALLINDLLKCSPKLLEKILRLAQQGVPVFWLGEMPARAEGWSDAVANDRRIDTLREKVQGRVHKVETVQALLQSMHDAGIDFDLSPSVQSVKGEVLEGLRVQRRVSGQSVFVLLFNDSEQDFALSLNKPFFVEPLYILNPESGELNSLADENEALVIPARRSRILKMGEGAADWNEEDWYDPPIAFRPYIRWWWPGNKVDREELLKELRVLHEAGFGGVEIQTLTIGMRKDFLEQHADEIYRVGTSAWFDHLRPVFKEAHNLGLKVDLTLGSGWPTGGPFVTEYPEQQLLMASADLQQGNARMALPKPQSPTYIRLTNLVIDDTIGAFDHNYSLQAVSAAEVSEDSGALKNFIDLKAFVDGETLNWKAPGGEWKIFAFYQNASRHNVFGSAFPGAELHAVNHQAYVNDHLNKAGAQEYIDKLGEPWLQALAPYKPQAFFIDSFELIAELPWSSVFRETFLQQHGYDIAPYLPLVFRRYGESKYFDMIIPSSPAFHTDDLMAKRIREDYESTRARLFSESYVLPLKEWMQQNGVLLRLQAHGGYGDYLDNYQLADIPESEALFAAGSFDFLKLASSAGHVAGRKIISSESFILLTRDFNQLQKEDYYYLAGNAYAAGINRLMYHGYAYQLAVYDE